MMINEWVVIAIVVTRHNFNAILVHMTFEKVYCSEFGFGKNERVRGGNVFCCCVHEFIHTVPPGLNRR
jgi:hypothetical protein